MSSYRYAERAAGLLRAARSRIRPHQSVAAESAISVLITAIVRGTARRRRRRITPLIGILGDGDHRVALVMAWTPWRSRPPVPFHGRGCLRSRPDRGLSLAPPLVLSPR